MNYGELRLMFDISDYQIVEVLNESSRSMVCRARRIADQQPVILKRPHEVYPNRSCLKRYEKEYGILRSLETLDCVVKAWDLVEVNTSWMIVVEDFGGSSLNTLNLSRQNRTESLIDFLRIAIQVVEGLGRIHAHQVIHKDINPSNIVFNPQTHQIKFIDFDVASRLNIEAVLPCQQPTQLEGTLAYMSPEQTGRLKTTIDYRTDYYALGATFFTLLAGHPPFKVENQEPIDLIHAHLTRRPIPLHEIEPDIPRPLSSVVTKLLEKDPGLRYQSAHGLCYDLKRCLEQLQTKCPHKIFPLGTVDTPERLQVSKVLYGRDGVKQQLIQTLNSIQENTQGLALISGASGVGKSSLVTDTFSRITHAQTRYLYGKYDQNQETVPYSGLVQALNQFIEQVLSESKDSVLFWQKSFKQALGRNIEVIGDLLPNIKKVVGECAALPLMGPSEWQNRFNWSVCQFMRVITPPGSRLIMSLDDIQWADPATLNLLQYITNQVVERSFIICTYRDQSEPNYFTQLDLEPPPSKTSMIRIDLKPLSARSINYWLSDTFNCELDDCEKLSNLVAQKTGGNPYFAEQLIYSLYTDKLIYYDRVLGKWQWDIPAIKQCTITDNVADFLAYKISLLNPETSHILTLSACIGKRFDTKILAELSQMSFSAILTSLQKGVEDILVRPDFDLTGVEVQDPKKEMFTRYTFTHDRVQQAAYDRIPGKDRPAIHYRIGKLLLANLSENRDDDLIFSIVEHLNQAINLAQNSSEREHLAILNLRAGKLAKRKAAYSNGLALLKIGLHLLSSKSWEYSYDLTLELYSEAIEAAFMSTEPRLLEHWAQIVFEHGHNEQDKVTAYENLIQSLIGQDRQQEAIHIAIEILRKLGVKFPAKVHKGNLLLEYAWIRLLLLGRGPNDLDSLEQMQDPNKQVAVRLFYAMAPAIYFTAPDLMPFLTLKNLEISVRYGNAPGSAMAYAGFGLMCCGVTGNIREGYEFGQLALRRLQTGQFQDQKIEFQTQFMVNTFVIHWVRPLQETLEPLLLYYRKSLESGDFDSAANLITMRNIYAYYTGQDLATLYSEVEMYSSVMEQIQRLPALNLLQILHQSIEQLITPSSQFKKLLPEIDQGFLKLNNRTNNFFLHLNKLIQAYLFGYYDEAIRFGQISQQYQSSAIGTASLVLLNYYLCLALLSTPAPNLGLKWRIQIWTLMRHLKKWSKYAPDNVLHKYFFVQAEWARVQGKTIAALNYYERAVQLASDTGYLNDEALIHEAAARFVQSLGQRKLAQYHISNAYFCYQRWGCQAKVSALEHEYGSYFIHTQDPYQISGSQLMPIGSLTTSRPKLGEALDFHAVLNASQAISNEIQLEKLLDHLMQSLIKNTGANIGILVLKEDPESYLIQAIISSETGETKILQRRSVETLEAFQVAVIHYVIRMKEYRVIDNANQEPFFFSSHNDPEHHTVRPQSILCVPLINLSDLVGVVYLENHLMTGAFTQDRLTLVTFLSSQAAISIKNAILYQNQASLNERLHQVNEAYSRFVPRQFLDYLSKENIVEIRLGDQAQHEMTILFCDIFNYTTLSETMNPSETFEFINEYLCVMEKVITQHDGFIDKYIGDGIMALFQGPANNALNAAINMLNELKHFNKTRQARRDPSVEIGIGLNTGMLTLGVVGGKSRMDTTVISDAVNLAFRIEQLTREYNVPLIISDHTYLSLDNRESYAVRKIGCTIVKGRSVKTTFYEVFNPDPTGIKQAKYATKRWVEQAVTLYEEGSQGSLQKAYYLFQECLALNPQDPVVRAYLSTYSSHNADHVMI